MLASVSSSSLRVKIFNVTEAGNSLPSARQNDQRKNCCSPPRALAMIAARLSGLREPSCW